MKVNSYHADGTLAESNEALSREKAGPRALPDVWNIWLDNGKHITGPASWLDEWQKGWRDLPEKIREPEYNYYKARYYVQTAHRANLEGCACSRNYGYVVRIEPPVFGEGRSPGRMKYQSWCKTKAIAERVAEDAREAQRKGYHGCPCGSQKQARACCGIPDYSKEAVAA